MADWQNVTAAEAKESPYYGFGGWLWLFYAYAIVETLLPMIGLFITSEGLANMYGPENVTMMQGVMAVNLILPLPFLVLAPLKSRLMPSVTIITFWISALLFLGAMVIGGVEPLKILWVVSLNALTAAAYTWYLLRSKRVNVTYNQRIPT